LLREGGFFDMTGLDDRSNERVDHSLLECAMSTFYLLPPRCALADHLAHCVQSWLPGIDLTVADREQLLAALCVALPEENIFLVHREDLPPGERAEQALIDGHGAGAGDEVVEVRPAARPGEFSSRRWRIGEPAGRLLQTH
jgi:hypothetical protein